MSRDRRFRPRRFLRAGAGNFWVNRLDQESLFERTSADEFSSGGHGAQHDGVVAQRREEHAAALVRAGHGIQPDDVFHNRHDEVAARLDDAAAEDDRLGVDQVPHVEAGVAQHFGRASHHFGDQFILDIERLADHAAANDRQIAAGQFQQEAFAAGGDGVAQIAFNGGAAGERLEAAATAAAAFRPAKLHDHMADFAGRFPIARHSLPRRTKPLPMPVPTQM